MIEKGILGVDGHRGNADPVRLRQGFQRKGLQNYLAVFMNEQANAMSDWREARCQGVQFTSHSLEVEVPRKVFG